MRCSDLRRRAGRASRALGLALALLGAAASVEAHKSSDSYLQLDAKHGGLALRWDIALRDLDIVLDLDGDGDGKLTWGEVRTAWPRIEGYALRRLAIEGCPLASVGRGLERRNDGAYAVLMLRSTCTLPAGSPRIQGRGASCCRSRRSRSVAELATLCSRVRRQIAPQQPRSRNTTPVTIANDKASNVMKLVIAMRIEAAND